MEIEISGLSFGYSEGAKVLHNIDLKLEGPGLICIVGPNGVGKSTLVKCINRMLDPTKGNVTIDGCNVKEMTRKEIAMKVGYVPPKTEDLFSLPVFDAIMIGRHNYQKWKNTEEDIEIVYSVMKLLKIEDLTMRSFNRLSSGQHQKVSLARGIVQDTEILILDEPTSNLDVKHQVYVTEMLRGISRTMGKLILMISHDLNIAAKYADQIVVMASPGIIHSYGRPIDVITQDMVRNVYEVDCKVNVESGVPNVVLGTVLSL